MTCHLAGKDWRAKVFLLELGTMKLSAFEILKGNEFVTSCRRCSIRIARYEPLERMRLLVQNVEKMVNARMPDDSLQMLFAAYTGFLLLWAAQTISPICHPGNSQM